MLWLAGLVSIAGVGAAAFVGLSTETEDDEEAATQDKAVHDDQDSMLNQIKHHSTAGGLLDAGAPVSFSAQPHAPTGAGWGDDVLNDIMSEIAAERDAANETAEADTPAPEADTVYSAAMLAEDDTSVDQMLSDWIAERNGADRLEYEASTEGLMLVWDDSEAGAAEPDVTVAPDPDNPEVMQIAMNGETVAQVHGDASLNASDLTLIPLSSAVEVGLEAV